MEKTGSFWQRHVGHIIMVISVIHLITGFILNWSQMLEMLSEGLINTVDGDQARFGFFWFQIAGVFMLFTGSFLQYYLNEFNRPVPEKYGYYLLLITVMACLMEPLTGFYILIPVCLIIILSARKKRIRV